MRGLLAGGRGAKDNASPQASEAAGTGARLSPRCAQPAAASEATGARARLSSRRAQPARRRPTLSASIPDRVEDEQGGRSLLLPALALGLLVGLVGAAFRLALELATQARHAFVASAAATGLPGAAVSALVSAAGVGLAVWLVRRVAPETAGSGIQEIEGALDGVRPLRWRRVIPVKFAGGILAMGAGLIAGREGPTVQMGGALGRMLGELGRRSPLETHVLVAAGAGAGLTAAFNAPLAGILFVIEEMRPHFRYGARSTQALAAACVVADVVIRALLGTRPEIEISHAPDPRLASLWLFAVLGALFGLLGPLFNALVLSVLDLFARVPRPLAAAAAVGALVGALDWGAPVFVGGGYEVIGQALRGELAVGMLLVVFAARTGGTALCYGAGAPGGIFAPMLALGTLLGLWFGDLAAVWQPGLVPQPDVFTVAGMGALFAAVVRAPLTGIALALGLTGDYQLLLPVLATCLSATVVSYALGGAPIYSLLLERTLRAGGAQARRGG